MLIRQKLLKTSCVIDTHVFIANAQNFYSGANSRIYHASYIHNRHGSFSIGRDSHLGAFCYVNAHYGSVAIGDHVAIGPGTKLISYSNHYRRGSNVTDERVVTPILINNNVFIGANCVILPGTVIQDNVIVGQARLSVVNFIKTLYTLVYHAKRSRMDGMNRVDCSDYFRTLPI